MASGAAFREDGREILDRFNESSPDDDKCNREKTSCQLISVSLEILVLTVMGETVRPTKA